MSGVAFVRGREEPLSPPLLSAAFRAVSKDGVVRRAGYHFRILLVDRAGNPTWDTGPARPPPRPRPVAQGGPP